MSHKNFTVYKSVNLITGEYYIGTHITDDPHDSYLGSGTKIVESVAAYGPEKFSKEILYNFDNQTMMFNKEHELVNQNILDDPYCLNLIVGGQGGFSYINNNDIKKFHGKTHTKDSLERMVESRRSNGVLKHTVEAKTKMSENSWARREPEKQKKHASKAGSGPKSKEHRRKLSEANKGKRKKQEKVVCPHCNKVGGANAMKRFHFDNCKNNAGVSSIR